MRIGCKQPLGLRIRQRRGWLGFRSLVLALEYVYVLELAILLMLLAALLENCE